jgi:hypothetical protein
MSVSLRELALDKRAGRGCRPRVGVAPGLRAFLEPVSGNIEPGLPSAETEIGKWPAETGTQNPLPKD